MYGVAGWTVVMPFETIAHAICEPNGVARWISVTAKDVDDPFFDSVHAILEA